MTTNERAALDALVPPADQTGNLVDDLLAATREIWRRREENTILGGLIFAALHRALKSWRAVAAKTGISVRTARRWHIPPGQAGNDRLETAEED